MLGRCLRSIESIVDEIVVVDTGSTDNSVSIAQSFGATVLHRKWDGDFSAARNFGLDHVRSSWILYIDADEYLAPADRADVQRWLTDPPPHIAYRPLLRARVGFTPYREYRIWRNHRDIRFWGVIHESHVTAIHTVAEPRTSPSVTSTCCWSMTATRVSKRPRTSGIFHSSWPRWSSIPIARICGTTSGGSTPLQGAIATPEPLGNMDATPSRRRGAAVPSDALIYCDLIHANVQEERPDASVVQEADMLFPGNMAVLWAGALDAEARGDFAQVVERLDRPCPLEPCHAAAQGVAVDERVLGEGALHLRGLARYKMGDHLGAAQDFAAAEGCDPTNVEYRVKRQLAELAAHGKGAAERG